MTFIFSLKIGDELQSIIACASIGVPLLARILSILKKSSASRGIQL